MTMYCPHILVTRTRLLNSSDMTQLVDSPANLVLQTTPGIRVLQAIKAALQICTQTRSTDLTRGIGRILQATSDPLYRLGQWYWTHLTSDLRPTLQTWAMVRLSFVLGKFVFQICLVFHYN